MIQEKVLLADPLEPLVAGIDEAGRGPVLGSMVYTICVCPESYQGSLKQSGVADSKALTAEMRESLLQSMMDNSNLGWMTRALSAQEISNSMSLRRIVNLNQLAHNTIITLIQKILDRHSNLKQVFIDTVGPPESLERYLTGIFPSLKIKVAKKADSLYPIVSAASIIAKVTRDEILRHWVFEEDINDRMSLEFGSGYPGDPMTIKWLKGCLDPVFGYPKLIRFSWSTCEKLLEASCIPITFPPEEEQQPLNVGVPTKKQKTMSSFFVPLKTAQSEQTPVTDPSIILSPFSTLGFTQVSLP